MAEPGMVLLRERAGQDSWLDVTAAQFHAEVAAGIEPGDRVALMSRTHYGRRLIDYAIWAAGAVTVRVYETSSAEQVEWILGVEARQARPLLDMLSLLLAGPAPPESPSLQWTGKQARCIPAQWLVERRRGADHPTGGGPIWTLPTQLQELSQLFTRR